LAFYRVQGQAMDPIPAADNLKRNSDDMIDVKEETNIYLSNFEQFEKDTAKSARPFLNRIRKAAIARFAELGFPTLRDEDWKFTNVTPIAKIPFKPAVASDRNGLTVAKLSPVSFQTGVGDRLVFVNGHYAPDLSTLRPLPKGVMVSSLATVLTTQPEAVEPYLARYAKYQQHAFTALNTAFIQDGAFVYIPKGQVVEEPIHLVFVATSDGEGHVAHLRNLVVAGANSQVKLVESYIGLADEVYFTNAVTEIVASDGAVIDHYKLQREGTEAFHVATTQVHQDRGSKFSTHAIQFGGALVRNEVRSVLDAEGCECTLNGLYLADGRQHVDNHTVIDHAKPHCASHELYKGILNGKAHGVFNGKIFVRQDAQKTDAKQTNQTLLLSEEAVIDTKPQLEIYADDVKCTHGATVGQLQEEAIFYLRSRGIGREAARRLLTFAFANDIISRIQIEPLRTQLEEILLSTHQLPQEERAKEVL
jgi:Fe-S cluster assembly protein SufD